MNVTLSLDDELIKQARRKADALGTSVNQLVRDYLSSFVGRPNCQRAAAEFEDLSQNSQGNSRGWKFDREQLHERQ